MTESILSTAAINAKEGRYVAIIDLPKAFLHAQNDEQVIMFMKGKLTECLVHIAPQIYQWDITTNNEGEKILCMKVQKVLNGMLKSKLLFYLKLKANFKEAGFHINPYDPCVSKKIIDGEQMTIVRHVDDLKVSHKNPWEVIKLATWLS